MIFYTRSQEVKDNACKAIQELNGTWKVSIKAPDRSLEQNDMVHTLIAQIAPHTPYDAHTLKEILKAKLLGVNYAEFKGEKYVIANKTSKLNKQECSLFIEELLMLAGELGVNLNDGSFYGYKNTILGAG